MVISGFEFGKGFWLIREAKLISGGVDDSKVVVSGSRLDTGGC